MLKADYLALKYWLYSNTSVELYMQVPYKDSFEVASLNKYMKQPWNGFCKEPPVTRLKDRCVKLGEQIFDGQPNPDDPRFCKIQLHVILTEK